MPISRRNFIISGAAAAAALVQSGHLASAQSLSEEQAVSYQTDPMTLWYDSPSQTWEEAIPVGNGRLGAMIFGGVAHERLQLNEITIWSGGPAGESDRAGAYLHLADLRTAIRQKDYKASDNLAQEFMTCTAGYDASYQTLGDLTFDFVLPPGDFTNYVRTLSLDSAIATVQFTLNGDSYRREVFSSAPAGLLAIRFSCSKPGAIAFTMELSRIASATTAALGTDTLVMTGNTDHNGVKGNVDYEVLARVNASGGTVDASGNQIVVAGADEAVVLLTAGTSYVLDYARSYRGADPHRVVELNVGKSFGTQFELLKSQHVAEYRGWFDRVQFTLKDAPVPPISTDRRLKAYGDGAADIGLAALFYQFGRYLLISSSRPDNPLPSNSQGIWGDGLDLPWTCDYKSNINFFMNYWPVETANLGPCHLPAIRLIESLVEPGRKTAQAYYDCPGWFYVYTTNAWGWTSPGGGLVWGVWSGASGWACQHLWEHYAFNRDRAYLKLVYPVMQEAAEFYLNAMISDPDGFLVTSPSTSPENYFNDGSGNGGGVTEGCAVEREIIWDLLTNVVLASKILQTDSDFRDKAEAALALIRPPVIGAAGQIQEWPYDWDTFDPEPHHRHMSHLFALMPGHQITPQLTPDLASAARKTMEMRGDEGTGWSKAWKINLMARLHDGDHAFRLLSDQLQLVTTTTTDYSGGGGTYANLLDAHPPFQIDGNFGALSGITEMLLQSHERYADPVSPDEDRYVIDLLPALPSAWPSGSVTGLRARGGFEVDQVWENGKLVKVAIKSVGGSNCKVRYVGKSIDLDIKQNTSKTLDGLLA